MKYICAIADLINSQNVEKRGDLQNKLKKSLDEINNSSRKNIVSPYTITLGDEFQVVYSKFETVFSDFFRIIQAIHPVKLRFSVSIDTISTSINRKISIGMDGPVFYRARKQLVELKDKKKTIIRMSGENIKCTELINAGLNVFSNDLEKWNETAIRCFGMMLEGKKVEEMTDLIKVKKRMIYKAMSGNGLRDHLLLLQSISNLIKEEGF